VLYEINGHVATVTLNRPAQRNAPLIDSHERLSEIWRDIDNNPRVRVAILTGSDCGTFCAGADLKQMAALRAEGSDYLKKMQNLDKFDARKLGKPVIAAINGFALAGGMNLALNCDLRVAVRGTQLGITEVHRGRGFPWAMPLLRQMPQALLSELTLVGNRVAAGRSVARERLCQRGRRGRAARIRRKTGAGLERPLMTSALSNPNLRISAFGRAWTRPAGGGGSAPGRVASA